MSLNPVDSIQLSLSRLIHDDKKYLLAFSSGGDSVFLLYQLYFYFGKDLPKHVTLVYINYHDSSYVKEEERIFFFYLKKFSLSFFKKDVRYRRNYGNFEDWARNYRYSYFSRLCKKNGYEGVITAHQKSDVAETYVLQVLRNNLPLYYGLKEESFYHGRKIIRPRLSISKQSLTKRLLDADILFYDDITNYNRKKKRNKIRSERTEEDIECKVKLAERRNEELASLYSSFQRLPSLIPYPAYLSLSEEEKKRLCFYLVEKCLPKKKYASGLGKKRFVFLRKEETGVLKLTAEIYLYRWKEGFFLHKDLNKISYEYTYKERKEYKNPYFQIDLKDPSLFNRKSLPVTIRNYKKNDRLGTDLMEKDVYRFLRKQGVPAFLIPVYPVFLQNGKIQCVPFYKDIKGKKVPLRLFIL